MNVKTDAFSMNSSDSAGSFSLFQSVDRLAGEGRQPREILIRAIATHAAETSFSTHRGTPHNNMTFKTLPETPDDLGENAAGFLKLP
jgi:hypothetical protein